jgi:hypothetical protein
MNGMTPWQTDRCLVFYDLRHPKLPMPWPIWFCGQKSWGWRFTELHSDFYPFRQFSHSFSFRVTRKSRKGRTSDIVERQLRTEGLAFPFGTEG